jgi:hypothetical protein
VFPRDVARERIAPTTILADGSVDRLAKRWLTVDPSKLRMLR